MTTLAEKKWMGRVAALGCFLCHQTGYGHQPAQVHHLREGEGMAQRGSNWITVPLCERHHANSSPDGIHGQRRAWKLAHLDEMDALSWTLQKLIA